jgi:hypothetical protein
MTTFLEFYTALLKFVNFKLFSELGINNSQDYVKNEILEVSEVKHLQKWAKKRMESTQRNSDKYNISEEFKDIPEIKKLSKKEEGDVKKRNLFSNCTFLLNRETPIYAL